jgi:anti-sigma regulatory factor (Ser/Thr protein kinase)
MSLQAVDVSGFVVNGGDEACAAARRAVVAGDGAMAPAVREDLLLLVTELVANAVVHGDVGPEGTLDLEVRRWPERVRVGVLDPGAGFEPDGPRVCQDQAGGWGLFLIDRIADRWGVTSEPDGTCVWFEIDHES